MLVQIGARNPILDGVDLLVECHGRIRTHLAMARRLAETRGAAASEIRETASRVHRYFTESLPLHIGDEDELVVPLLTGSDLECDAALACMMAEHREHEPAIARLAAIGGELAASPASHETLAVELAPLAATLEAGLLAHLDLEERVVFPALRALPRATRESLAQSMRRRREPPR